jgi:RND family efflux transporter MFP subunit
VVQRRLLVSFRIQTAAVIALSAFLASCGKSERVRAANSVNDAFAAISVGVTKVGRKTLEQTITLSSELVPFQEIDVFAKESGYVKELNVDYGTRVQANQILAVLEIPELQLQLKQDDAAIKNASDRIARADSEVGRIEAQHKVMQLQFDRLDGVAKSKPGLVAQQEVDDSQGKALASAAQVEAAKSNLEASQSDLLSAKAKREHDQALFDYSKITAPFAGVVTQRYANLGALMQAGTSSSTQAMPLVRLSQDDLFRLVIPVPESYVHYIHIGDPVSVVVPSMNRTFPGKVTRFSVDVKSDTRTMHTEVDVANPQRVLLPGLYADAKMQLQRKENAVTVPLQAVDRGGQQATVAVVGVSNMIEIRDVVLGIQTETDAEVLTGLKGGELIVVSDRSSLKAGQKVRPKDIDLMPYHSPDDGH